MLNSTKCLSERQHSLEFHRGGMLCCPAAQSSLKGPPLVCKQGFEPEVVAGAFFWWLSLLKPILLGTVHGEGLSSSSVTCFVTSSQLIQRCLRALLQGGGGGKACVVLFQLLFSVKL